MEKRGFPPNDPLYLMVSRAYQASWELGIKMHYIGCHLDNGPIVSHLPTKPVSDQEQEASKTPDIRKRRRRK